MRIWGWVLLILGIVFLIFFTLAEFGGGPLGFLPFFISIFLIVMGGRLLKSGKGFVQSQPTAAPGSPSASQPIAPGQPGPAQQFSTVELALTPDVAAVIAAQSARANRFLLYIVAGCAVLFVGMGIVLAKASADNPGQSRMLFLTLSSIGLFTAALIYGISWLTTQRPVRRDLAGTTYLSTTGPISVVRIGRGGAMLRLADRAFLMNGRYAMQQLRALGHGRVDYSPHGHIILAVWDGNGRNVYTLPGYGPGGST